MMPGQDFPLPALTFGGGLLRGAPQMSHDKETQMITSIWGQIALAMSALAGTAAIADARRMRRRDFDRVGFMPWSLILIVSLIVAAFATAITLKGY